MKHCYSMRKVSNKEKVSLVELKSSIIPLFIAEQTIFKGQQALKLIACISCCLLLMACSSTTVHLYGKYLSQEQIQQLTLALKDDFDIEINQLPIPQKVQASSLIYSPLYPDKSKLDMLSSTLLTLGFDIENISPLVIDNHWYTGHDIGVMLLPSSSGDNAKSRAELRTQDLVNTYQTQQCLFKHKIIMGSDHRYRIELLNDGGHQWLSGFWRIRQFPYLEFKPDKVKGQIYESWYYFEISKAKEADMVSEIEMIKLTPVQNYPLLNNCHFASGLRV